MYIPIYIRCFFPRNVAHCTRLRKIDRVLLEEHQLSLALNPGNDAFKMN